VLELVCANAIEPFVFGQSTGSSPLALLLAAAFWAWLWGPVGLFLSTPLTVVLIVIGKYVPRLAFLEVLLGDEPVLGPHVVLYQRLVARDQDEATDLVEEYLQKHSVEEAYQALFLPALMMARQDLERGELDAENARNFFQTMRDLIDESAPPVPAAADSAAPAEATVLGCPARDEVDELALIMFRNLLRTQGRSMTIMSPRALTAEVLDKVRETSPAVVLVASVPPGGVAQARYLCKRLKTQCTGIKLAIGRWGEVEDLNRVQERLTSTGADIVSGTLAETRAEIVPFLQVAEAAPSNAPHKENAKLAATP
jgi:hypothetical protein